MAESSSNPPISLDTEYIKSGTFGLTLRPGLPNKKENGSWQEYPNSVTKLFFKKDDLLKAKDSANLVYAYTGNKGHTVDLYKHRYKKANIPKAVLDKIPKNDKEILKSHLYPMRMPNLGIDLSAIKNPDKYRLLRKINPMSLLHQIHKVLKQVNNFVSNNKVHADIREPNMMINPKTGDLTIIDFDFFMDSKDFFRQNNVAFYNRPIENYIYCNYLDDYGIAVEYDYQVIKRAIDNADNFKSLIEYYDTFLEQQAKESDTRTFDLGLYMHDQNSRLLFRQELDLEFKSKDDLIKAIKKNIQYIYKGKPIGDEFTYAMKAQYERAMFPTFDSYGLALSLLDLLVATYTKYAFHPKYSMESAVSSMFKSGRFENSKPVVKGAAGAAGGAGKKNSAEEVSFEDYSKEEIKQIYKLMQCVFYLVLLPMVSLDISERLTPRLAITILEDIIDAADSPDGLNILHEIAISQIKSNLTNAIGKEYTYDVKVVAESSKAAGAAGKSATKASKSSSKTRKSASKSNRSSTKKASKSGSK
jgi:hypothetical protein